MRGYHQRSRRQHGRRSGVPSWARSFPRCRSTRSHDAQARRCRRNPLLRRPNSTKTKTRWLTARPELAPKHARFLAGQMMSGWTERSRVAMQSKFHTSAPWTLSEQTRNGERLKPTLDICLEEIWSECHLTSFFPWCSVIRARQNVVVRTVMGGQLAPPYVRMMVTSTELQTALCDFDALGDSSHRRKFILACVTSCKNVAG